MILWTSEALWDFVSANRMDGWIHEGCDCRERMEGGGAYIVVRIWTILMGVA